MIYLLNNINFGHQKLSKYQIEYFNDYLLPRLDNIEKIIITGNLFYNTKYISFDLLSKIKNILNQIKVPIEILENDYCINIFDNLNKINKIDYDVNISLFQLSKEDKNEPGFYIIKDNNIKIIKNKITPRFIQYEINSIEDINIDINKDFIDIIINSELIQNQQNKNKVDIFLNNNKFNNVFYTEKIDKNEIVKLDSKNINIRNILIDNIENDLKEELNEVFNIHDEKLKKL